MANLKKYSKKVLCILSACVCFFMAVFYPFEEFKANENSVAGNSTSKTFDMSFNYSDLGFVDTNVMISPTDSSFVEGGMSRYFTYFYYYAGLTNILTTSSDVFAYRIYVTCNSVTTRSFSNYVEYRLAVGTLGDFQSGDVLYGNVVSTGSYNYWYENNYASNDLVRLGVMFNLYELHSNTSGGSSFSYPSIKLNANFTVNVVPYTVDDLTDELYSVLTDIYSTDTQMLSYLKSIYSSVDTVETKLQSLITVANAIESNTDELEGLLKTCNSYLASIQSELEEQTSWLEKIYNVITEFLGLEGEEEMEDMPSDDMGNLTIQQDELLGNASSNDLANDLTVSIDVDSNAFIWDIINDFVIVNSTVFGGFISVLSLGLVALILNR